MLPVVQKVLNAYRYVSENFKPSDDSLNSKPRTLGSSMFLTRLRGMCRVYVVCPFGDTSNSTPDLMRVMHAHVHASFPKQASLNLYN